ncbi:MAG: hypothetical protein M0P71_01650 [Melioribacteraceae bacterium]|nr:hypothetical protein [Melioribacteraceae bacterium]
MENGVMIQSREEYEDIMDILLDAGLRTVSGKYFGECDWFNETGTETVIDLRNLESIAYGEYQYFIDNDIPVCNFQDFLTEQGLTPNGCISGEQQIFMRRAKLKCPKMKKKEIRRLAKAIVREMNK